MTEERRQYPRRIKRIALVYYSDEDTAERRVKDASITINVSGGGIYMSINHKLEKGDRLQLKLMLNKNAVHCSGTVRRVESSEEKPGYWDMAVELEIGKEQQDMLLTYIES